MFVVTAHSSESQAIDLNAIELRDWLLELVNTEPIQSDEDEWLQRAMITNAALLLEAFRCDCRKSNEIRNSQ